MKKTIFDYTEEELARLDEDYAFELYFEYMKTDQYKAIEERATQKIKKNLAWNYNKELEKKVSGSEAIKDFKELTITKQALDKANYIANRTKELSNWDLEIYMYLLGDETETGYVVNDIFIGRKQIVSGSDCKLSDEGSFESLDMIASQDRNIIGWAHSHASFTTFHSGTDYDNLDSFISMYGLRKEVVVEDDLNFIKYGVSFSPSLVVNARNEEPDCAIAITYSALTGDGQREKIYDLKRDIPLNIIENDEASIIDEEQIDLDLINEVLLRNISGYSIPEKYLNLRLN